MDKENGLREIEDAIWIQDEYKVMNLYVHAEDGSRIHCWIEMRPVYCDRGHMKLVIDGPLDLDGSDSFPRYFFSFEEADKHTRLFLKWRFWKERVYPHNF